MKDEKNIIKASEEVSEKENKNAFSKIASFFKSDKIKNEALFKRGSYSIAITALVIAGLIAINWGFGALSDRFKLKIDISENKKNSISEKNIEYLKSLKADVEIIVCGQEDAEYMMSAAYNYGIYPMSNQDADIRAYQDYFAQTISLIRKYEDYNKGIKVTYVDINSTEFASIKQRFSEYSDESGYFLEGDIIVASKSSGQDRHRYLSVFRDIYNIEAQSDAFTGTTSYYTLTDSKLESSLTSAIDYAVNTQVKKAAFITSFSTEDYTGAYRDLLTLNNYEITDIDAALISTISNEYDVAVICAPTKDFTSTEIAAVEKFLDNEGKLGKGLIYIAAPSSPKLPNLNSFLKQWGIEVYEGKVFDTSDDTHMPDDPSTMMLIPYYIGQSSDQDVDEIFKDIDYPAALSGKVVPMKAGTAAHSEITTSALMKTWDTAVLAPLDATLTWKDYEDSDKKSYDFVIQAKKSRFDNTIEDISKRELTSYVLAFASVELSESPYAVDASYESRASNQELLMAFTNRAAHKNSTHTFDTKVITYDSFDADVTEKDAKTIGVIFIGLVPLGVITAGIVIFIRRRKAV